MNIKADVYFAGLEAAPVKTATALRNAILSAGSLEEDFKWGHPIYRTDVPVCLVKTAKSHVTLGFWQGRRLLDHDPRLEPSGNGDMAMIRFAAPGEVDAEAVVRLVNAAVELAKGS